MLYAAIVSAAIHLAALMAVTLQTAVSFAPPTNDELAFNITMAYRCGADKDNPNKPLCAIYRRIAETYK
jgi:hypothetical protein